MKRELLTRRLTSGSIIEALPSDSNEPWAWVYYSDHRWYAHIYVPLLSTTRDIYNTRSKSRRRCERRAARVLSGVLRAE